MSFREERGIGYCGLACVLCSYDNCPGCRERMAAENTCSAGKCASTMSVTGCYICPKYETCIEDMPHGRRNRVFNRYAREFGIEALIDRLRVNYKNGITYHTPDKTPGDYDKPETEEEIYQLLRYGRNDPYLICPEFETEHLRLCQVCEEDAEELLCFYGDLSRWMFYGNPMSNSIFSSRYPSVEEMRKCIRVWKDEYKNKYYIRLSVFDKSTESAIGTIEIFDNLDKARRGAALHIDLSYPYETQMYITELINLADREFFRIFGFKYLIIQAVPDAKERIAALHTAGYERFEPETKKHYYMRVLN